LPILSEINGVGHNTLLACLHFQNKSGFFEVPAFIQTFRAI